MCDVILFFRAVLSALAQACICFEALYVFLLSNQISGFYQNHGLVLYLHVITEAYLEPFSTM